MDIEKLIERLTADAKDWAGDGYIKRDLQDAATAIETLRAENKQLKSLLGETGQELWSAENQRADRLQTERDTLLTANQHLLAEREQLTAERDAAIADIAAILAEVEEIRRGYGVDNADADIAFADLCGNYCAKRGNNCYEEVEDYRCKNFMWRGIKED